MAIKSGETTYHQAKRGIVQNGLVLNLDAGVDASYDGGTTWRDLEGGNNGTLTNMTDNFDSANGGSIVFDGTDDRVEIADNDLFSFIGSAFSLSTWLKTSSTISSRKTIYIDPRRYRNFTTNIENITKINSFVSTIKTQTTTIAIAKISCVHICKRTIIRPRKITPSRPRLGVASFTSRIQA